MEPSDNTGVRERKKQANRNIILEAGRRVFSDIGFEASTVRDIVRESGLAQGTFYNYFNDKESVMQAITEEMAKDIRLQIGNARDLAKDPVAVIADAYLAYLKALTADPMNLQMITRNRDVIRGLVFQDSAIQAAFQELEADLRAAVTGKLLPPFPAKVSARLMIAAGFEVLILMDKDGAGPLDIEKTSKFLSLLFIGGIEKVSPVFKNDEELK